MNIRTTLVNLLTITILLLLGRVARSEIPFVISYYDNGFKSVRVDPTGYSNLANAGFNVVNSSAGGPIVGGTYVDYLETGWDPDNPKGNALGLAQQYGMRSMVDFNPLHTTNAPPTDPSDPEWFDVDARVTYLTGKYGSNPTLLGYRLRDEPSADEWTQIAEISNKLLNAQQAAYGNTDILPWVNILPNYSYGSYGAGITTHKQYMDSYIATVQPKVLCYDEYTSAANTTYPGDHYDQYWEYSNLQRFRQYGQANNIPFWRIIESNLGNASPNTEGIYREQTYTSLAYGATGILYFTYTQQDGTAALAYYKHQEPGVWGEPTTNGRYQIAQTVNGEVNKLAPLLMSLTSTKVMHTDPPSLPSNFAGLIPAEDIETFIGLDGVYVDGITGGEMLLGEFEDANNRTYLMLVNKDYVNNHSFSIQLDSTNVDKGLGRVDKSTGKLVLVDTPGGILSLNNMTAGDGELFKVLEDNTLASTPDNLSGIAQSRTAINVSWDPSVDAQSGIDYYGIYRDGVEIGTSTSPFYSDTGLLVGTTYEYMISAFNGEGLESLLSDALNATTISLNGDANGDGMVDVSDLGILAMHYGAGSGLGWRDGDFTDDGIVDVSDLGILATNYGNSSFSVTVPEPSIWGLLASMLLMAWSRRWRCCSET